MFTVQLIIKPGAMRYFAHNVFVYDKPNVWTMTEENSPVKGVMLSARVPEDGSTYVRQIDLMTPMSWTLCQHFTDTMVGRRGQIYELQKELSEEQSKKRLGTLTKVNICSVFDDGIFYVGRSYGESPEVDPVIFVASQEEELNVGDFVDVKIVDCSDEYDLTAVTI